MAVQDQLLEAFRNRRTYYALNKKPPVSDDRIEELVRHSVLHTPSAFNSQSARLVLMVKADHEKLWELVKEVTRPSQSEDHWKHTEARLDGFKAAYGTILFFEHHPTVRELQDRFPKMHDFFPQWSEHTSAMHQYALWTALEADGLGANLQHNTNVAERVVAEWDLPEGLDLKALLVFGGRAGEPKEKTFKPVDGERLFVFGK